MSHPDWDYFGDPRVGLPAEDIAGDGFLADDALLYPGQLIRGYVLSGPAGVTYQEDGSHDYSGSLKTVTYELYVDGVYIDTKGTNIGSSTPGSDTAPLFTGALADLGNFMNC